MFDCSNILECFLYCKRKPIKYMMAKLQSVTLIAFVVSGFLLWFDHAPDWLKNNKNSRNIVLDIHSNGEPLKFILKQPN